MRTAGAGTSRTSRSRLSSGSCSRAAGTSPRCTHTRQRASLRGSRASHQAASLIARRTALPCGLRARRGLHRATTSLSSDRRSRTPAWCAVSAGHTPRIRPPLGRGVVRLPAPDWSPERGCRPLPEFPPARAVPFARRTVPSMRCEKLPRGRERRRCVSPLNPSDESTREGGVGHEAR